MEVDKELLPNQPLVSVIICTYNAMQFIDDALNCILNQTYRNLEIIICDDYSTDGTREYLESLVDKRIKLYLHSANLGYVRNKNFGHKKATGEYLTQLDNDDLCDITRIEKQLNVIKANPDIRIVGCGYERIDDNSEVYFRTYETKDRIIKAPEEPYPFWFPSLLVHKSVFVKIGYFDEYFAGVYGDDLYWTVKANEIFSIYFLCEHLYSYRNNPNSITNVFSTDRKLIFTEVLRLLINQRKTQGSDFLEQNKVEKLMEIENSLLNNKSFLSKQYQIWAAKAIDKKDFYTAKTLLKKSLLLNPMNFTALKTAIYLFRSKF